ncbi:MAG: YbjQ family protein [Rhodospirillales bacterium]|nr:YbjQ family protein [Rhodospirillales bacterium]MCW8862287.1 YbjQ family protein [Rhodospirillales bacterium]MCW8952803.1 YbjQ family protein [Rhodospirillales bacterium]MCW8971306.1 YbjQ family protein [Rhodospirillales bacterium]MCW9001847.1 YbjQ family protein [Rhodospirillales bacterium]
MIVTTTDGIDGRKVTAYLGVVSGEAILGANIFKDFLASVRDIVGGRSGSYEKVMKDAKNEAMKDMEKEAAELGADAILAVDLDYEVIGGDEKTMLMVSVNGTAVKLG